LEEAVSIWETNAGDIAAVLHPVEPDEAFIHIHPSFRTDALEEEIILHAEVSFFNALPGGGRRMYIPVDEGDVLRKNVLNRLGYSGRGNPGYEHFRDLDESLTSIKPPAGFTIRPMGDLQEHPARSWASWLAFHSDEPAENYDGDFSWYANIQSAPLYRRDLDLVAVTEAGEIASFSTIYYDDTSRSAIIVLDGTAAPFQRRGLGKAVLSAGLITLQSLGCCRVFAKATDLVADRFYDTVLTKKYTSETWIRDYHE
jgi:hypothetical protein